MRVLTEGVVFESDPDIDPDSDSDSDERQGGHAMNLARVVGKVWATRKAPGLEQATLLVIQPVDGDLKADGAPLAALDLQGSAMGQVVYFVGSKEAALPLKNKLTPVDATIVGIVDRVDR